MTSQYTLRTSDLNFSPNSLIYEKDIEYGMANTQAGQRLAILAATGSKAIDAFDGEHTELGDSTLVVAPLNSHNAAALRSQLNWLQLQLLGLKTSAGMGDRIGLATPGHVRAMRSVEGKILPIFAQQSIREMMRTNRSPQQVMDDAMWGVFAEGWQGGAGADADHLKTTDDIDACLSVGYTFFTIDPGGYVDNRAETASISELRELAELLPVAMKPENSGLLDQAFAIEHLSIKFDEATLLKAAVKYGKAVDHVAMMYHHLANTAGSRLFELEVSVDETDLPTSHAEHIYVASELKRLGVKWVSLAPRYVGRFEKGVDYIGDVITFEQDIAGHAAIARHFGPYKLSLHSGSDKFRIYRIAAKQTHGLVHLKTAGTSYLEALRTIAAVDVDFFREIYCFARERYNTDKLTYHVSADLDQAPLPEAVKDWTALLDQFDAREIFHVNFGSVLTEKMPDGSPRFHGRFIELLKANAEAYAANLERHFKHHLEHFVVSE
jgi:hypothetical protein